MSERGPRAAWGCGTVAVAVLGAMPFGALVGLVVAVVVTQLPGAYGDSAESAGTTAFWVAAGVWLLGTLLAGFVLPALVHRRRTATPQFVGDRRRRWGLLVAQAIGLVTVVLGAVLAYPRLRDDRASILDCLEQTGDEAWAGATDALLGLGAAALVVVAGIGWLVASLLHAPWILLSRSPRQSIGIGVAMGVSMVGTAALVVLGGWLWLGSNAPVDAEEAVAFNRDVLGREVCDPTGPTP